MSCRSQSKRKRDAMKGTIFVELVNMAEEAFGEDVVDEVLPSGGDLCVEGSCRMKFSLESLCGSNCDSG